MTSIRARQFTRLGVQARAKIRIGKRAYAGYIENISEGGARIVTLSPIRDRGAVTITVPDLRPLKGDLRWSDGCAGGVQFRLKLDSQVLHQWLSLRMRKAA
ncbi:MAG: PilZ domain-containing protein [Sphingomicrobium sp.]